MIRFFRKIRQQLPTKIKFSKYLQYAIGEIVLVVIGILIALQVNNWNQERIARSKELKILIEINFNLDNDLKEIRRDIILLNSVSSYCDSLKDYIEAYAKPSEKLYDKVAIFKAAPHFDPNLSGYKLLMFKGVDIIQNDDLRSAISYHYESSYPFYSKYEEERILFKIHQTNPYLLQYFTWSMRLDLDLRCSFQISEEDYSKIRHDGSFSKIVSAIEFENRLILRKAKKLEKSIMDLIDKVNTELESRE